jgi:hypothetical protein
VPRQHRSRGGRNRSTGLTPSRSRAAGLFLASLLLLSFGVGSAHAGTAPSADAADSALSESNTTATAAILAVYPDPTRDHDAGEYVLLRLPDAGNWSVSDGEATTRLRNVSGRVLVTPEPRALGETVGNETTVVEGSFALANGGEAVSLRRGNETVHRVRYGESSEGERYLPAADEWRPRGLDPRSAVPTGPANATAFLLPDSPKVPIETLREAEDRILLAGYTFTSERVADVLLATRARGVDVRVLVEADPVGGASAQQARVLDRLAAAGVEVRVVGVGANRFAYHHPKYAVADGRALGAGASESRTAPRLPNSRPCSGTTPARRTPGRGSRSGRTDSSSGHRPRTAATRQGSRPSTSRRRTSPFSLRPATRSPNSSRRSMPPRSGSTYSSRPSAGRTTPSSGRRSGRPSAASRCGSSSPAHGTRPRRTTRS